MAGRREVGKRSREAQLYIRSAANYRTECCERSQKIRDFGQDSEAEHGVETAQCLGFEDGHHTKIDIESLYLGERAPLGDPRPVDVGDPTYLDGFQFWGMEIFTEAWGTTGTP